MFGFFEDIGKAALAVVTIPVAVVADVVTLGGSITNRDDTYTGSAVGDLVQNLKNATKPD